MPADILTDVEIKPIVSRKLTQTTCQHFGYGVAEYKGKQVQVAPYYNADGQLVAQKTRGADKSFKVLGDLSAALPFGSHAFPKTGKMIVVTEGELDALAMSQAQGNKWPVVSISCGADNSETGNKIKKYIAANKNYFNGFDEVVIMFDNDAVGRKSAIAAAEVLGRKAKIAELPLKDAGEMLVAGRTDELITAMWRAKPYRPEGIVALSDLHDAVKEAPQLGMSWPWPGLTALTYGIQRSYIYTIGAATGAGKTDVIAQVATHLVKEHRVPIGLFLLEQEPRTSALQLASKWVGSLLHTPEGWDETKFEEAWKGLTEQSLVHLYDSFGVNEWDSVKEKIEYLHHAYDVKDFFVDHLTAFAAGADDERRALESIMADISSVTTKLGITIYLVSHLATAEGKPHEEGGRVMVRHFKGSRAIGFWSHGIIGLERNQQAEDPVERNTTVVRMLKLRGFGWNVGKSISLAFDKTTGFLEETEAASKAESFGFNNETNNQKESDF